MALGSDDRMARAPCNVFVIPYRRSSDGTFEYALLKRSDTGCWHAVSGGVEDDETPLEAARRETWEETGVRRDAHFVQLDTVIPVPVTEFRDSFLWGDDVYVIPQYSFGVLVEGDELVLSREHGEYHWMTFAEASRTIEFADSRLALWELDRRVRGLGPRD